MCGIYLLYIFGIIFTVYYRRQGKCTAFKAAAKLGIVYNINIKAKAIMGKIKIGKNYGVMYGIWGNKYNITLFDFVFGIINIIFRLAL